MNKQVLASQLREWQNGAYEQLPDKGSKPNRKQWEDHINGTTDDEIINAYNRYDVGDTILVNTQVLNRIIDVSNDANQFNDLLFQYAELIAAGLPETIATTIKVEEVYLAFERIDDILKNTLCSASISTNGVKQSAPDLKSMLRQSLLSECAKGIVDSHMQVTSQ